jgi:hypothetical protein
MTKKEIKFKVSECIDTVELILNLSDRLGNLERNELTLLWKKLSKIEKECK